jgi:hypothetical protein
MVCNATLQQAAIELFRKQWHHCMGMAMQEFVRENFYINHSASLEHHQESICIVVFFNNHKCGSVIV